MEGTDDTLTRAYAVPPPVDTEPPVVTFSDPTTATILTSDAPTITITVTGTVSDNRDVERLLVNGEVVTPTLTGAFTATVTLRRGVNGLSAVALDPTSNVGYSPLIPITLLPARSMSLTVSENPARVGQTIFFQSVISSGDVLSDVLWHLPLPTTMVTDVVVMANSGTTTVNTITPGVQDAVWQGDVGTTPVTITVSAHLTAPGSLNATATAFWGWGIRDTLTLTVPVFVPTGVMLADFAATPTTTDILVTWETASETDNLGFNLWRGTSPTAPSEQLNEELILSQSPGGGQGAIYEWLDKGVGTGTTYYYWLDAVSMVGTSTRYGPVSATLPSPTVVTLTGFDAAPMPLMEWWFGWIFLGLLIARLKWRPPFRWR